MGWSFWGGFLAVALILTVAGVLLRNRIRAFSRRIFGRPDLLGALEALEDPLQAVPRSLNGMDRLLLPQILRDFPDFDLRQAKEAAKAYLRENLAGKEEPRIHNVVLSQYFPALVEKTMVFQAAVSFREGNATIQKRYDLSYAYRVPGGVGANCPNCGGVLAPGQLQCAYCGAWVANPMGAVWSFTRMEET